ncbi:MAG: MarR family winged helix-turn-helix transcriptional regulator [Eubacteriales bacterium]|nr:MarR family winged helix-turn-helix transcriptional regulator [Eubacteriales bacterium]
MKAPQKRTLGIAARMLNNIVSRYIDKGTEAIRKEYNITPMHGYIIAYLAHNDDHDIYQKEIEEKFFIRSSTVTSMIKLMEKNGLITRESVEQDARLKKIVLTDKAKDMQSKINKAMYDTDNELTGILTKEELDTFFEVIEKIKNKIQKGRSTDNISEN